MNIIHTSLSSTTVSWDLAVENLGKKKDILSHNPDILHGRIYPQMAWPMLRSFEVIASLFGPHIVMRQGFEAT